MNRKIIAITTGDVDGIGLEVAAKALSQIGPSKNFLYLLFRSPNSEVKHLKLLQKKFSVEQFGSTSSGLVFLNSKQCKGNSLVDLALDSSPPSWVIESAQLCQKKQIAAMVTGPLSKTLIRDSGFKGIGHTDLLKKQTNCKNVFMTFLGNQFQVMLVTDHIAISNVTQNTKVLIKKALFSAQKLHTQLNLGRKNIIVLGLNPHAGESGLISKTDAIIERAIEAFHKKYRTNIFRGPLSPDAAFLETNRHPGQLFLCMYHDQGLIPFKAFHGQNSGVHLSWGLPIIRTSVDHGTAKDLYGKGKANPNSMIEAIEAAQRLIE